MKKGKKLLMSLLISAFTLCAFPEKTPVFDGPDAEKATVLDSRYAKSGRYDDFIRVINLSDDDNISFKIYVYSKKKKTWKEAGVAKVKGFSDIKTMETPMDHSLEKYTYFAIVPQNNNKYVYKPEKKTVDIYIKRDFYLQILVKSAEPSKDTSYKNKAFVIDAKSVPGSFKENIRFESQTKDEDISFTVYGFNDKEQPWTKVGIAELAAFEDSDTVEKPYEDELNKFSFFGIVSNNGKAYTYEVNKNRKDICIYVK